MVWTIEASRLPLFAGTGHLYIDIWNDDGNRVMQINGLATDRLTGQPVEDPSGFPIGGPEDQLMIWSTIELDNTGQTQGTNPNERVILFTGSQQEIMSAIARVLQLSAYINAENLSYGLVSFNSNTVFSAVVDAMASVVNISQQSINDAKDLGFGLPSIANPGVNTDIFRGDTWAPNPNDTSAVQVGAIVQNTSSFKQGLTGTSGDDQLFGLAGNDVLIGREGADLLDGGNDTDTADYSDAAEKPAGAEQTLALDPPFDHITVRLGDFSAENVDFKIIDRYGDIDSLVSVEKVIGQAGADNMISIIGTGTLQETAPDIFQFNGKSYEFENFTRLEGDTSSQTFALLGPSGRTIDGGGGDDQVDYSAGFVWDVAGGRAWDYLGLASDTLLNVEKTTSASVILPDLNRSGGVNYHFETVDSRNTIVFDSRYVDYSHALTSATFNLGTPGPVVINNVIQSVALLTDYDQVGLGGFTHLYGSTSADIIAYI